MNDCPDNPDAIVAVCDVLVLRALEVTGKRIVKLDRSRFSKMGNNPWHVAHTIWQPDSHIVNKALAGAWDILPIMVEAHGCCGIGVASTAKMLDDYTRDLLVTGRKHNLDDLRYRFESRLHVAVKESVA